MSKKQEEKRLPPSSLYDYINYAYWFFNKRLFDSTLPDVMITLTRRANSRGYFVKSSYHERHIKLNQAITKEDEENYFIGELSLNPVHFNRPTELTYSTLCHEQVHIWQHISGSPARDGYHNQEWADKMESIGLIPSDTGKKGGARVGQSMTHYIKTDGPYKRAYDDLASKGQYLMWTAVPFDNDDTSPTKPDSIKEKQTQVEKKNKSKTRYTCPVCMLNAWAKPDVSLFCGDCEEEMLERE